MKLVANKAFDSAVNEQAACPLKMLTKSGGIWVGSIQSFRTADGKTHAKNPSSWFKTDRQAYLQRPS